MIIFYLCLSSWKELESTISKKFVLFLVTCAMTTVFFSGQPLHGGIYGKLNELESESDIIA